MKAKSHSIQLSQQNIFKSFLKLLFPLTLTLGSVANAISVDWSGVYRFEYTEVDRTSLANPSLRKSYFLNYLSLAPKIIAADGVNIISKFNVLDNSFYPDSQVGQAFGSGTNQYSTSVPASSSTQDSRVAGGRQRNSYLQVSQLYLNINQEYGAIVVGRAPIHFGLGMAYNAGNGPFDHWSDTRDLVGYKFLIGNLSIMPIIAKVYDYSIAQGRDAQDMIWNIEYNNAETESIFGLWHQTRTSSQSSNDAPAVNMGGAGATTTGSWSTQDVNIYLARGFESVKFRLEAGFRSGTSGITTAAGEDVKVNGYGIALETDFVSPESKGFWQMRAGVASGDNPGTANFEGYHMNRNYDVAFLLMNHPLGTYDLFRSNLQRNRNPSCNPSTNCAAAATDEAVDEEVISNVYYLSPRYKYSLNDKMDLSTSLTYAQLQNLN